MAADYEWGRQHLPAIRRILGEHLIVEAPLVEDTRRATDLIVLRLEAVRIAVRMRRATHPNYPRYADEFTIRAQRPTGAETELRKILDGWGDYFLYGWADDAALHEWALIDLGDFRRWHAIRLNADHAEPGAPCQNRDGTSFRSYRIGSLPASALIARRRPRATHYERLLAAAP